MFIVQLFSLRGQVEKLEGVLRQLLFQTVVKGAVCSKTRRLVDFNQERFEVLIKYNIEPKYLEAKLIFDVIRLALFERLI